MQVLLFVCVGTADPEAQATVWALEQTVSAAFPGWISLHACVGSRGAPSLKTALSQVTDGAKLLLVPLLLLCGIEYERLLQTVRQEQSRFSQVRIGAPLLDRADGMIQLSELLQTVIVPAPDETVLFLGHGTTHEAGSAYGALNAQLTGNGPWRAADLQTFDAVQRTIGTEKVLLLPLTLTKSRYTAAMLKTASEMTGKKVRILSWCLGELPEVQALFVSHAKLAKHL